MNNNGDDKTPHRKTKIEQHESHLKKGGGNYIAPEGYAVSAPLIPPVVRVTFVKHPVIGLERGKDGNMITIDVICHTDISQRVSTLKRFAKYRNASRKPNLDKH